MKEYGFKKHKDEVENYLSKKYVPKEKKEEEINDDKNSEEENNKNIKDNKNNNKKNNNNQADNETKRTEKRQSILSRNKMSFSSTNNLSSKFQSNRSIDKKIERLKFRLDKPKSKFKLKELINNFSVSNVTKKRELLIPLKIKKKNNLKKNETINEISSIEKPKNLKKFLFNSKQELSEADFQDFPFNLKKKGKEKEIKSPTKKNESEDNDVNDTKIKNTVNLQNVDFSTFIGTEKKISFLSPSRGRNNLYRKSIFKKTKAIFDNL